MAKNRNNARIWGAGLDGGVWYAPKGSTEPNWDAGIDEPTTPWKEFGWLGEDGVDFEQNTESESLKAWPAGVVLRKVTTSVERTWKFLVLEETAATLGFVHPGLVFAETSVGSGVYHGTVPAGHAPVEMAGIFFFQDGENYKAAVCPTVIYELTSSVPHKFDEITAYEFTATSFGEYELYVEAGNDFVG